MLTGNIGGWIEFYGDPLDVTVTVDAPVTVDGGIRVNVNTGKLTLNGSGTLDVSDGGVGNDPALKAKGLEITGSLTVNASTTSPSSIVSVPSGDFIMSGGTLKLSGDSRGIEVSGSNVNISGAATVKTNPSVTGHGIYSSSGSITISGSAVVDGCSALLISSKDISE